MSMVVICFEFFGGENTPDFEIRPDGIEHLQNRWDIAYKRDVDGLDLRPEGETAIGDYERISVPDTRQQVQERGIENA